MGLSLLFQYPAMSLPPIAPLFLIVAKSRPHLPHLVLFWILCKFHPHFEGPDLLLPEYIHPDGQGDEGTRVDVGRMIDRQPEHGIVYVAGRVEDVKIVVHDLGHEEAGAVGRYIDDPPGKRTGEDLVVFLVHHMDLQGEKIGDAFGSAVFNVHKGQVFC